MSEILSLKNKAAELRSLVFDIIYEAKTGHTGSDLSCTDILTVLYYKIMNVDPNNPSDENRDRYIQSKGHAAEILWAIMADKGFIQKKELKTFSKYKSRLIGHPNNKVDGIEMNTGSLGHGLGISVGISLAAKLDNKDYKIYTLLGDGELAEGSVWEAAMAASHYKLDNLTAIIDNNGLQITGKNSEVMTLEPLADKWESFGWYVIEIDGNDIEELISAFEEKTIKNKPKLIIAHTIKGKGYSESENQAIWHHRVPTEEEYLEAKDEFMSQEEYYEKHTK